MTVCCPSCDQPLPIRQLLFNRKPACPHCQVKLKETWRRSAIIQVSGLIFVVYAYCEPTLQWQDTLYRSIALILLMWTLLLVMPGQYRVVESEEEVAR
jgi:uncharacterized paraquat-inducible protein A